MPNRKLIPKFVLKEMDSLYLDELRSTISQLMLNLESLPVSKGGTDSKYGLQKLKRYNQRNQTSNLTKELNDEPETILSKTDVSLLFKIEVIIVELKGLKNLSHNRVVYCTMEVDNNEKLQTDHATVQKPFWDTQGDFTTQHPLPFVKIKLFAKSQKLISLEDKELGKLLIRPTPTSNKSAEWHPMIVPKNSSDQDLKLKVILRMDKPNNMKHCGNLYAQGKQQWKKWKNRYFVLIQVSQYTFAMCSFLEKKTEPTDMLNLDGYTVDFIPEVTELAELGGKYFFNAVKEGDSILFARDDENECALWVMALYRATGQAHKPTPLNSNNSRSAYSTTTANAFKGNLISRMQGEADRVRKLGMDEYINQSDPCSFNHHQLFRILQNLTLSYRLNEPIVSLGWLSPPQQFVLEEYSARYGVRSCFRQLCFLSELLDRSESGYSIDPHLINLNFSFCSSFVHGLNEAGATQAQSSGVCDIRPDGIATVTHEEKEIYLMVKDRLMALIEFQLTNFRYCFPFGRPEGQLKATLTLLERVLMKDVVSPTPSSEVRSYVKKCLESAALINYTAVSKQTHIEESINDITLPPNIKLHELIRHAEICVDMVRENNESYAEECFFYYLLTRCV